MSAQILEWADLAALATSCTRLPAGVASTFGVQYADAIEDLAVREMDCCGSWLTITTRRDPDTFHLLVQSASPDGVDVIASFLGLP